MLKKSYKSAQYLDPEHAIVYAFGKVNGVIIGDIDGNGFTDIVTFPSNYIYAAPMSPVVWSNTNGVFTPNNSLIANITDYQYFRDSIPGDFNGDGLLDYVQVDQGWELNNRDPKFAFGNHPALLLGTKDGLQWVNKSDWLDSTAATKKTFNHIGAAADYDADGDLDIAIAAFWDYRLYKNDGTGNFTWQSTAIPASIQDPSGTTFIKLGDKYAIAIGFYRSWKVDVAYTKPLSVLTQTNGVFSEAYTLARPDLGGRECNYGAVDMYNMDINGDGREDLLVTWETENGGGFNDGLSDMTGVPHTPRYKDLPDTFLNVYLQDKDGRLVADFANKIYTMGNGWDSGSQAHFFDLNKDGFVDFYSTSMAVDIDKLDDLIWLNDGKGGFYKSATKLFETTEVFEPWYEPSPFFFDANNDGAVDVVAVRAVYGKDYAQRTIGEEVTVFLNGNAPAASIVRNIDLAGTASQYKVTTHGKQMLVLDPITKEQHSADSDHVGRVKFSDLTLNLGVKASAATVAKPALDRIVDLYVAFFARVPDGDGLQYWIAQHAQGKSINEIAESFYNAGVYYSSLTGYRADMSNSDFVNIVYRNVLGRSEGADADGLKYWSDALSEGKESKGSLVSSILDAAYGPVFRDPTNTYHWVQALLLNKLDVAKQVAVNLGVIYNSPEDTIRKGMAIAAAVTPTATDLAIGLVGINWEESDFSLG